jgi:signal peptidase I
VDPTTVLIKRVVGIPGDRIRIADKQLYLNGVKMDEPYAKHVTDYVDSYRDQFPAEPNATIYPGAVAMLHDHVRNAEVVVPPGQYFVLGDNRDNSLDSRYWGFVPRDYVLGRAILVPVSYDKDVRRVGRVMVWLTRFPLGTT